MKKYFKDLAEYSNTLPVMIRPQLDDNISQVPKFIIYVGEANFVKYIDGKRELHKAEVTIFKNWFDNSDAKFVVNNPTIELLSAISNCRSIEIPNGTIEGNGFFVTQQKIGSENYITGLIKNPIRRCFSGIDNKNLNTVYFHIFNFRKLLGKHARTHHERIGFRSIRLIFKENDFVIELYSSLLSEDEWKSTKDNNYGLTYTGVLIPKDGFKLPKSLTFKILKRFGQFISFLNGSNCFPKGIFARNVTGQDLWIDYTNYITDEYPKCCSWLPQQYDDEIGGLWSKFYKLEEDEFKILERIMDWYIQANVRRLGLQSAFISAQVSLEIIFNFIVDVRKDAIVKKEDSKYASGKIQFLLDYIGVGKTIPEKYFETFKEFLNEHPEYDNFPYLFADVRNSFTHADPYRKEALKDLNTTHFKALLNIALCYTELLLLKILNYKGSYANRLSMNVWMPENEEYVPWINNVK